MSADPVRQLPPPDAASADARAFVALPDDRRKLLLHVSELLEEIAFGNVIIVLQDGAVIQIETSEKIRLR